jgi:tetratricopeptide (TPR) repeat protein
LAGSFLLLWTPPIVSLVKNQTAAKPPVVNQVSAADEAKVIVLVSEFAGPNPESYGVTQIILEQLTNAVKDYKDVKIKPLRAPIDSSEAANAKAKEERANIVLWGSYLANAANTRVTIHFEVIEKNFDVPLKHDNQTITASTAKLESFTIQEELSKQMTYLVLLTVGTVRMEAQDFAGAITSFTRAISASEAPTEIIEPEHIYEYRGFCYLLNGQLDEAISDFSRVLSSKPQPELLNMRAMAYMAQRQFDKALQDASSAIEVGANDESYALRGFIYEFVKDDSQRAWTDFEQALARNPINHSALSGRGTILMEREEWDLAIMDFQKVLSLDISTRKKGAVFNSLALAYEGKGELQKALANYSLAIEAKPEDSELLFNRATFFNKHGQPDQALADADKAVSINPADSRNYTVRGTAFLAKGQADKAIADYSKAISLDPNGPTTYGTFNNRGLAYSQRGDHDKAIEDYTQAIKLNPTYSDAYASRCNTYLRKGEFDRAFVDCNQSINLNPKNAAPYQTRGAAFAEKGLFSQAMADFNQSIRLNPQNPWPHVDMGMAYRDQGQKDKAIAEFTIVVQMGSDWQAIVQARRHLCELDNAKCQPGY